MNKILVTGATGFLGGRLMEFLFQRNAEYKTIGIGRNQLRVKELEQLGYNLVSGDIADTNFLEKLSGDFDCIIHCAAKSSPWGKYIDFYQDNVVATRNLLDFANKRNIKKFIHISTPSIYFNFTDRNQVSEDDPLPAKLVNFYATTKLLAEQEIANYPDKSIKSIIIRPRGIIGRGDTVIFPRLIKAYEMGKLKRIGNTNPLMDVTNVDNLIHAIFLALQADEHAWNKTYNICNGTPVKFWDLVELTFSKLQIQVPSQSVPYSVAYAYARLNEMISAWSGYKMEPPLTTYSVGLLKYGLTMNIDKAKKYLKYSPVTTTEQAIDDFINGYKI